MRYIYLTTLAAGLLLGTVALAQPDPRPTVDLNRFLQDLFPVQSEGIDYQAVFDALAQLYANPLDLNTATRDELAATYLLDERQLASLLAYRAENGSFLSIYELQAVPGLSLPLIRRLLPFVTVTGNASLFGALPTPTDNYLIVRYEQVLETQRGFVPAEPDKKGNVAQRYLGNSGQYYARYRYSRPRAFSFGFTLEKDPGESIAWNPSGRQYGADYISFHAQLQNRGRWRNVVLGDYQVQIGQGLVLSAGFVLGKSAETVQTVRRPTLGARPYSSLTEYGYLRGATATYAITPNLDLTLLAARNRRDANVTPGSNIENPDDDVVTSLQTSGLHRTRSELADRGSLLETNMGAHLLYHDSRPEQRSGLQLGLTILKTNFGTGILKRNQTYNRYEFVGKQNMVVGVHGGYVWRNVNFFGEAAHSSGSSVHSGGIGAVGGALASLTRRLDMAIVARHYDRNFHSFYANAFSESTRSINETGVYIGLKYTIYRKLTVGGFVDKFTFPWWKYLVDRPSGGFDYLLQATYTPNRRTSFNVVYHDEHKEKNLTVGKEKTVVGTTRRNLALNADYTLVPGLSLRSRVQYGGFGYAKNTPSRGFAVVQDATYERRRLSVSGRVALFGTDDYDSRQYVYERDVLYAFSFPSYFYRGIRQYVLVQYNVSRHLDLWFRWARTDLTNRATVGSDLDRIDVPHKSEIKLQARWRF
ncbi:MAG: helix-hairpin-helix domain-containing protein [Bacteroidetes bacterium]|nr:helix-hairpin-helix domain-containing protein [Fibrella sp.]